MSVYPDFARRGDQDPRQRAKRCRLSRPIRAHQPQDLTGTDLEVKLAHRRAVAVSFRETRDPDHTQALLHPRPEIPPLRNSPHSIAAYPGPVAPARRDRVLSWPCATPANPVQPDSDSNSCWPPLRFDLRSQPFNCWQASARNSSVERSSCAIVRSKDCVLRLAVNSAD